MEVRFRVFNERRLHPRVPLSLTVVWEGTGGKYEARTSDISASGCFVDSIGQVALGELISFKLQMPAGDWLEVQAQVTNPLPPAGFGVRFESLSDHEQKRLEALTRDRNRPPSAE